MSCQLCTKDRRDSDHQTIVKSLIDYLKRNDWQITHADLDGYDRPPVIKDHIPDVRAWKEDEKLLAFGEAETCGTLTTAHTRSQLDEFSNRVLTQTKKEIPLYVSVPSKCFDDLKKIIADEFAGRQITPLRYTST